MQKAWQRVFWSVLAAAGMAVLSGCVSNTQGAASTGSGGDLSAPRSAPRAVSSTSAQINTDVVRLSASVPDQVTLGETYQMTISATAVQDAANVVITDSVPDGASLVSSEPQAQRQGNVLTWNLGSLNAGETSSITINYRADREGQLQSCATVTAVPRCCVSTFVGRPVIAIAKSGPAQALLGETVNYSIVVRNTGTAVARNVVVTDQVPEGLSHSSGQRTLTFTVGDLAPGQSREIALPLQAAARGNHCNVARVTTANAGEAQDDACTLVVQRGLTIAKTGTAEQFVHKQASYQITVRNTGDVPLTNVVVTDVAPAGTRIESAPGATVQGQTATWQLATLAAGAEQQLALTLIGELGGNLCNRASASSAEGLTASAEACTLWRGHPALLIEVVDSVDPLLPGETTVYTIEVTNQGTADDRQVYVVADFPANISPVSQTGDTAGTIAGKKVTFAPRAVLGPKQKLTWKIEARAEQTSGDNRLRVQMFSELLKTPVTEEESTHVY